MFRNKEFRRFSALFLVITAAFITASLTAGIAAGILAACFSVIFGAAFYVFTRARYKNIARISKQIDLVLHNAERFELSGFDEGELSILHSDITKMTLRIREQNDALIKDKQYLADSLADIAHQLRTPLTSANLILSFLEKNPGAEERLNYARELEELLLHMDRLITSLLKLSRLDAGVVVFQNEPINVSSLIESALRPFLIPFELRGINLKTNICGAVISGDFNWLSEALQNILKNCMESTGDNGMIEISCADNNLFTELIIRDNGAGFGKDDLPHIFDRFYRGENENTAGYGIGLSLSRMIITRQNGIISAKNHTDGGAVFTVRFQK
jgi:hypothetical protein